MLLWMLPFIHNDESGLFLYKCMFSINVRHTHVFYPTLFSCLELSHVMEAEHQ